MSRALVPRTRRVPVAPGPELEPRWHSRPGTRYFVVDEIVRLDGERGGRYRIRGFRTEGDRVVAELFGAKAGRTPGVRTVPAERIRRP